MSILIPLFNEEDTIEECLKRILAAESAEGPAFELLVVDDASTDRSVDRISDLLDAFPDKLRLFRHEKNRGKGAAIRTAIAHASGEFCIIQDADLEYSPDDYPKLLKPLLSGDADVVFGSRFAATGERRVLYFWHSVANRALTLLSNMFADLNLTDMETCYKAFRTNLVKSIPLRSERFGIEPELTIKLAQRGARIYETSITYHGRTYQEGKKIGLKDAFQAVAVILRYGLLKRDIYSESGPEILDILSAAPRFNAWMAETVSPFLSSTVLEIGAGIGNLSALLMRGRRRYIASDIDPEHLAHLRRRYQHKRNFEVVYADLEDAENFQPFHNSIDSVVCLNVLEHVGDDAKGLSNIFSVLRPGGKAIILVPEGMSVYGTLDEVLGHHRRYSESELKAKLESAGFRVERILHFNRATRPGWFVNGRIRKQRTFGRFQIFVFDRLVWLWRRIDRLLPWSPTSIIAVAVRPNDPNA